MISVICAVYNGEKSILRAAQSILDGTYKDIELILVDDGSTDGTAAAILRLAEEDKRVKPVFNEGNRGLTYSLNKGLAAAQGQYIARMDADDFSYPERLEKQLEFLESHREFAFVASAARLCHNGKAYGERRYMPAPTKSDLASRCTFIHPTLLIRREAIDAVNGYRDKKFTRRCEDYDLYFRLYKKGLYGYNLKEALLDYEEDPADNSKHTPATRINEFIVRMRGCAAIRRPLGFIKAFKCLLLIFVPKRLYFSLKNARTENEIYD